MGEQNITIRKAETLDEVLQVQELDAETWPEGYKHYKELWELDKESIYIAVTDLGEVVSYVGVEKIRKSDLGISMPGWDHNPGEGWVKEDGDVWYITGHVVREDFQAAGLSNRIMTYLINLARNNEDISTVAVFLRENHPTLGKTSRFWEHHGMKRLAETYDSEWKASPQAEDSGGVIYAIDT